MLPIIRDWIKRKTLRDLGIVFIENILSKGINFILIILIARTLGPEQYGLYSFVTVSILFLAMFFNFSMENSAVRFSGRYRTKEEEIFGVYFLFRTAMLSVLLVLILLFPNLITKLINKPIVEKYLLIIFIGCVVESYQYVITAYLQSQERFFLRAIINSGVFLLRLISIFILIKLSIFNIKIISLCFALSGIPFVLLFFKYFINFLKRLDANKIPRDLVKKILQYSKWMVFASIATQIMTRLDFYLVTSSLSFKDAGLYNVATQLIFPLMIFRMVAGDVFLPKVSKYKDLHQIKNYIKKVSCFGSVILVFVLLLFPFCRNIILFIFGKDYLGALGVFQILLFAYLFTLWNVLLSHALYSMGYSRYMAIGAYIHLIVFVISALTFIPKMGMIGAAWGRLVSDVAYLAFVGFCLSRVVLRFKGKTLSSI